MTRRVCTVCNGEGTIANPRLRQMNQVRGRLLGDNIPDTSLKLRIQCQNCNGTGWAGEPDK